MNPYQEKDRPIKITSSFIARWGLPNEGIPIYILWEDSEEFDAIRIHMPEQIVIRDYYNVSKTQADPRQILKSELKTPNYLGLVISSPLIDDVAQDVTIKLEFVKSDQILQSQEFQTRIVRPKIELKVPEKIEIASNDKADVEIKLRRIGYGNIYGKIIIADDRRKLILDVKDLRDLFLVMASSVTFKKFVAEHRAFEDVLPLSEIPEDQYDYRNFLLSHSTISEFTPRDFFSAIQMILNNRKLTEILEKEISTPRDIAANLFESVIDFIEKRPVEGVYLADMGAQSLEIEAGKRHLFVGILYVDDIGNYYSESRAIPIILESKNRVIFGKEWEVEEGNWKWLKKQ